MPQKRNSEPPKVMTWGKATPVLVVAAIFDAARFMFTWFIFFGPALAALYCATKVGDVWLVGGLLTKGCVAAAAAGGAAASGAIMAFGMVMAMATGFAGWLVVGGVLMATNARIFKENTLWFAGSLFVSQVPIMNSLPAITGVVWKMYGHQIKIEEAAFKKWKKESAEAQKQERNQQIAQIMQVQAAQQQAANDELYAQQAANDEKYDNEEIPEEGRRAV